MKLSITSWSFTACTLAEAWAVAQAIGIDHMDLGLLHRPALDRAEVLADPVAAAARVAALGINVSNLYWLFGDTPHDRAISDPAARVANLRDLDAVLRFAEALECSSLFVLPGVQQPGVNRTAVMERAAEVLLEMLPLAASRGVTLTVEPHVGGILDSPKATLRFLEMVPGLKLTLDYAHFACLGFAQSQIDPLAPYAAHVHLRQARPGALQCKWGEGTLDFGALVENLRNHHYSGFLSLEYVHQAYMGTLYDDVLTETIQMRDHVLSYIGSVNHTHR